MTRTVSGMHGQNGRHVPELVMVERAHGHGKCFSVFKVVTDIQ